MIFDWLFKSRSGAVLAPGSRGGKGYRTRGGTWRYGARATPSPSPATSTPPLDQAREVAQRLWGTDVELNEADGRCRIVQTNRGTARDRVLADEASWPEALAAAKVSLAARPGTEAPPAAIAKAATKGPLLRFAKPPEAEGAHQLGTTTRGKPVHASGADAKGFTADDHRDAAALHHRAALHHDARAEAHRTASTEDDDWKRSEIHHQEAERHGTLAEHHHAVARDHMVAGGNGGTMAVTLKDGKLESGAVTPHDGKAQADARERIAARTHWGHPGGLTPKDQQAYGTFGQPIAKAAGWVFPATRGGHFRRASA